MSEILPPVPCRAAQSSTMHQVLKPMDSSLDAGNFGQKPGLRVVHPENWRFAVHKR